MSRQLIARSQGSWSRLAQFPALVLTLFFLALLPARAELQFDVFVGYDGLVREASWTPFVCELKNDSLSIKGVIEVSTGNLGKGQTYQIPIELPTGTMKRVTIPVFSPGRYLSTWNVRLLNEKGKVIAEKLGANGRRQVGWEIPLIGSLSRTASGAPTIRPIATDAADAQPAAARMQPAIFPDNPLVLEGLNAIYLSSDVVASLRSSQANAILAWMNAGGHLIVGLEQVSDVTASPWLRTVLPCEPKDLKTLQGHPEFQRWVRSPLDYTSDLSPLAGANFSNRRARENSSNVSADAPFAELPEDSAFELADIQVVTGTVRDGQVRLSCGNTPMIITATRGQGRITALMFSPEREPFKSWKGLSAFWARMVEVPGILYSTGEYAQGMAQSPDGIFGAMIDSRQVNKLPLGWLLVLLVIYLAVIGPFDQWWLKRIGKPMLTWITFPCYVALFSLLIYFIGFKLRSGESEYNELHLVDVLHNGAKAEMRGRTYASIYSPSNSRFPLVGQEKFATLRGEFLSYGAEVSERGVIEQTGDSFRAEVFVPVWTSQLFLSDWWHGGNVPLETTVRAAADGWTVTVKNATTHTVKASQLLMDNQLFPLGEVTAGQTINFTVSREQGIPVSEFVRQNGGNTFSQVIQRRQSAFGASKGGRLNDVAAASMAASFLSQLKADQNSGYGGFIVPPGMDLGRYAERGGSMVLAWSPDERPVPAMNQFKPRRLTSSTLWRVPVTISK